MLCRQIFPALSIAALAFMLTSPAHAEDKVLKVGTLKLIHTITPYFYEKFAPAGYKIEVIPFETPTDAKNAVVTKSVDFAVHGLAAAILGAAAGEPVVAIAPVCNKGMAIVVHKSSGIQQFKDLTGKRVAILPGSTQEAVILDRLKAEGMTIKDVRPVRLAFSEMASALERNDIDAYIGAEPGPSISLTRGVGKVLEFPYTTPVGTVNIVMTTHAETLKNDSQLVQALLETHRKATEYAIANRPAFLAMASAKLGLSPEVGKLAVENIELVWQFDDRWVGQAKYYSSMMLERKQIRREPDYTTFFATSVTKP